MKCTFGPTRVSKERWQQMLDACRDNAVFWAALSTADRAGVSTGDALTFVCTHLVEENDRLVADAIRLARSQPTVFCTNPHHVDIQGRDVIK